MILTVTFRNIVNIMRLNNDIKMKILLLLVCITFSNCYLQVYSPPELVKKFTSQNGNMIPFSIANFGQIPYGRQMSGEVVIANPMTNCEYEQDISDYNGGIKQNKFLLMLRGDCTFVKKVTNAQQEGNQLAIIMDNVIEKTQKIVMANDGYASHINIPSIFIGQQDGQAIIDWMSENPGKGVILSIRFETNMTETVDIGLWLNANSRASYVFVRQFNSFYNKINSKVKVSTSYYTFVCNSDFCSAKDCFSDFQYCAFDPDGPQLPGTGQTIILQQLREFFIFQTDEQRWWDYMSLVDLHCVEYGSLEDCSNTQMKKIGIDWNSINNLVKNSFQPDGSNPTLQTQSQAILKSGIIFFPDVTINSLPYLGDLEAVDVFQLVCNSIRSPPSACNNFVYDGDKIIPPPKEQSHVLRIAILSSIFVILFFVVLVCVYRRIIRRKLSRQMNNQVNQLVSQYITLYQTKKIEDKKMTERI